jgi:hypothetical protein
MSTSTHVNFSLAHSKTNAAAKKTSNANVYKRVTQMLTHRSRFGEERGEKFSRRLTGVFVKVFDLSQL